MINLILVGATNVGKKSIKLLLEKALLLISQTLTQQNWEFDENEVNFIVTSDYDSISNEFQSQPSFIIYIYDITNQESFNLTKYQRHNSSTLSIDTAVLLGNKIDMEYWRVVDSMVTAQLNIPFIELSAHTGMNFELLVELIAPHVFQNLVKDSFQGSLNDPLIQQAIYTNIHKEYMTGMISPITTTTTTIVIPSEEKKEYDGLESKLVLSVSYDDIIQVADDETVINKLHEDHIMDINSSVDRHFDDLEGELPSVEKSELAEIAEEEMRIPSPIRQIAHRIEKEEDISLPIPVPKRASSISIQESIAKPSVSKGAIAKAPLPVRRKKSEIDSRVSQPSDLSSIMSSIPQPSSISIAGAPSRPISQILSAPSAPSSSSSSSSLLIPTPSISLPQPPPPPYAAPSAASSSVIISEPFLPPSLQQQLQLQEDKKKKREKKSMKRMIEKDSKQKKDKILGDEYIPSIIPEKEKQIERKRISGDIDIIRREKDEEEEEEVEIRVLPHDIRDKQEEAFQQFDQNLLKMDKLSDKISMDLYELKEQSAVLPKLRDSIDDMEIQELPQVIRPDLESQTRAFHKKASRLPSRQKMIQVCCIPCICIYQSTSQLYLIVMTWYTTTSSKLFDDVLADNENAFQTLAKFLIFFTDDISTMKKSLSTCYMYFKRIAIRCIQPIYTLFSGIVLLVSSIVLILPSFFTLLVIRTTTVEKESTNFGIRQEVIRHEKVEKSLYRWLRIILRSLPLSTYILVVPYILIYQVFPSQSNRIHTTCLFTYISVILLLQVLGTIRAYYSSKNDTPLVTSTTDASVKSHAPELYETITIHTTSIWYRVYTRIVSYLCCCCGMKRSTKDEESHIQTIQKPTPIPDSPQYFNMSKIANYIVIASLTLELFQLSVFPLQNNPYADSNTNPNFNSNTITTPTMAPTTIHNTTQTTDAALYENFFAVHIYHTLYINLAPNLQYISMWATISIVFFLILLFVIQFFYELITYGLLLRYIEKKDLAKDYFFYSFTGSIIYGHGKPRTITPTFRMIISLITDSLFLIINLRLLTILACNTESPPRLLVDNTIICWQNQHAVLATLALSCYAFYVPLSIMIAPILLTDINTNDTSSSNSSEVTYNKVYLMVINILKSIMLLVTALGPQTIFTTIISSTVSSCLLAILTLLWFQSTSYVINSKKLKPTSYIGLYHYYKNNFQNIVQPCNKPFINTWKAATYTLAVSSALIVITAHLLGPIYFPLVALTPVLIGTWMFILIIYGGLYYQWYKHHHQLYICKQAQIQYPYIWRDEKLLQQKSNSSDKKHIGNKDDAIITREFLWIEYNLNYRYYKWYKLSDYTNNQNNVLLYQIYKKNSRNSQNWKKLAGFRIPGYIYAPWNDSLYERFLYQRYPSIANYPLPLKNKEHSIHTSHPTESINTTNSPMTKMNTRNDSNMTTNYVNMNMNMNIDDDDIKKLIELRNQYHAYYIVAILYRWTYPPSTATTST